MIRTGLYGIFWLLYIKKVMFIIKKWLRGQKDAAGNLAVGIATGRPASHPYHNPAHHPPKSLANTAPA